MRQLIPLAPLAALAIAGCVPRVVPPPAPAPAPAPPPVAPTPAPAPAPTLSDDWRDWPLTPGEWRYQRTAAGGVSTFGVSGAPPGVTLTCDRAARRLTLARTGASNGAMTIITTSTTRTVASRPDGAGGMAVSVAATDSLLDAIGYSRGRFVIEQAGLPTLVVPAWPEIERVTEDCRG
jgi:hypothetical protein